MSSGEGQRRKEGRSTYPTDKQRTSRNFCSRRLALPVTVDCWLGKKRRERKKSLPKVSQILFLQKSSLLPETEQVANLNKLSKLELGLYQERKKKKKETRLFFLSHYYYHYYKSFFSLTSSPSSNYPASSYLPLLFHPCPFFAIIHQATFFLFCRLSPVTCRTSLLVSFLCLLSSFLF